MIEVRIKVASGGYVIEDADSVMGINETYVRASLDDAVGIAKEVIIGRIEESRAHEEKLKEKQGLQPVEEAKL